MKKFVFLAVCTLFVQLCVAQNIFLGRILDQKNNEVLPSANILIVSESKGISSQSDGTFQFSSLLDSVEIECSALGYMPQRVILKPNISKDIFLTYNAYQLRKVEILLPVRAGEHDPFAKTMMQKDEISKLNSGKDLPILLDQTPGTVVYSDAGNGVGYTGLRIRGSDITRINVTFDGIPVNDAESQSVFWVNTPDIAGAAQNIQIQRGVGASTMGSGSFGASINVNTHNYEAKPYAELMASYGSFNTYKTSLKAGSGLIAKHFTIDVQGAKIHSDGYIDRAFSDLYSLNGSLTYWGKKTTVRFNAFTGQEKTYQAWNGVPQELADSLPTYNESGTEKPGTPYHNETDNYRQDYYRLFVTHKASNYLTLQFTGFLTRGKGYYEQYKGDVKYSSYNMNPMIHGTDTFERTDLIRQLHLNNFFYGALGSIQYKKDKWDVKGGVSWFAYDGRHYGDVIWASNGLVEPSVRFYNFPAFKNEANVYAKLNYQVAKKWYLYGDLQYRYVNYKVHGFRNNPTLSGDFVWHFVNPKVGTLFQINSKNALFASFAMGNKEPNRDDLEAGTTTVPKPETLYDVELGYEFKTSKFAMQWNAYYMHYSNQLIQTGKINDVGAYTRVNVPVSFRTGLEFSGTWKIHKMVSLGGNLSYSYNKIKEFTEYIDDYDLGIQKEQVYTNTDIAFSPNIIGGVTLSINPVKGLHFDLIGKGVSRQYLDNTQNKDRSLPGFFTADFRIRYDLEPWQWANFSFFVNVYNFSNMRYTPNGYTYGYYWGGVRTDVNYVFPMAGIHANGGVIIRLKAN